VPSESKVERETTSGESVRYLAFFGFGLPWAVSAMMARPSGVCSQFITSDNTSASDMRPLSTASADEGRCRIAPTHLWSAIVFNVTLGSSSGTENKYPAGDRAFARQPQSSARSRSQPSATRRSCVPIAGQRHTLTKWSVTPLAKRDSRHRGQLCAREPPSGPGGSS
jgi:hypothetical protein